MSDNKPQPQILPPTVEVKQRLQPEGVHFRPMLSAKLPSMVKQVPPEELIIRDLKRLDWSRGFDASPKLDGIRAVKSPEGMVSRTLTPTPNRFVQDCLSPTIFNGLDGELVLGNPEDHIPFNDTQSAIQSQDGSPFFTWCIFDDVLEPNNAFWWRTNKAMERVATMLEFGNFQELCRIYYVKHKNVKSIEELLEYEAHQLSLGYEGIMFRDPGGRYKSFPSNRSTFKEQGLIKLKRFVDGEARITGFVELERNTNPQKLDKLGYAKRSHAIAGQVGGNTLGKLDVIGINGRFRGVKFYVASGLDDHLRDLIWNNQPAYLNQVVKYKFQDVGAKDAPRAPIFLGFRSREDL